MQSDPALDLSQDDQESCASSDEEIQVESEAVPPQRGGRTRLGRLTVLTVALVVEKSDCSHCHLRCTDTQSWDIPEVLSGGNLGHINVTCMNSMGLNQKVNFQSKE